MPRPFLLSFSKIIPFLYFHIFYQFHHLSLFYLYLISQLMTSKQDHMVGDNIRIKPKDSKPQSFILSHYSIDKLIGKGGFGKVYKAVEFHTKQEVAVKIIKLRDLSSKQIDNLRRQVDIQLKLNHPNIVKIYEVIWTETKVYMFMELAKGCELFEHINKYGRLKQPMAAKIFYQIVSAVQHMHEASIAHRDIKTQNIIIDADFNAKLIDFGLAKSFCSTKDDYLQTFCGSPSYVSPQMLESNRYSGQRVDIWCLGITLYVMLEASLPFDDYDRKLMVRNIKSLNWHQPIYSSSQASQLYNKILTDAKQRITLNDILHGQFLKKHKFLPRIDQRQQKIYQKGRSLAEQKYDKVGEILKVKEERVREVVERKQMGQIFCVYQILLNRDPILSTNRKWKSEDKNEAKDYQAKTIELKRDRSLNKSQDKLSVKKQKDFKCSPSPKRKQLNLVAKQIGVQARASIQKNNYNIELFSSEDINKQVIDLQSNRFKKINKKLKLEVLPRIRHDSADSPKRIGLLKNYN